MSAVTSPGHAPKPRDPRLPVLSADEITAQFSAILDEPAGTLEDEVDQLTRAHAVLNDALQRDT